jgi:hypothetical protein
MRFHFLFRPAVGAGFCRARLRHFLLLFPLLLTAYCLLLPVSVHAQGAQATSGTAQTAPAPRSRFAAPPPAPTPFVMEAPVTDKRMNEEALTKYKDHPEQREKDMEHDRLIQHNAALHEQAVRDRQAYVADQQTRTERDKIVADQLSRNPFLEAKPKAAAPEPAEGLTKTAAWIVAGVLLVSLLGLVWWKLFRPEPVSEFEKTKPPSDAAPSRPVSRPQRPDGRTPKR